MEDDSISTDFHKVYKRIRMKDISLEVQNAAQGFALYMLQLFNFI